MPGRILFLLVFVGCITNSLFANDTLTHITPEKHSLKTTPAPAVKSTRSFASLDNVFDTPAPFANQAFYLDDYVAPVTTDQEEIRAKIEATYKKVFDEQRFIDFLDLTSLIELPVGIKVDLGALQYAILIDSVVMTPTESFLYASMLFQTPQGKKIHFLGSDIKFSKNGGLTGDGKLMLVGDYPIKLDGENSKLIIKGSQNKTFVEFDCKGYKQMSLDASLVFSRELLIPEGADGNEATGNVSVDFTTTITDWNDILLAINVPKFRVNGLKDVTFAITDAILDFSDTRSIPAVKYPEGYNQISPQLRDGSPELWQGVYIRELLVTLPPQFEKKDESGQVQAGTGHRISFKGNDLIIDNVGFSGRVSGNNLIPIDKGKIGNWNFSLETIYVKVVANELVEGGFNGKVNIPINKAETSQASTQTESSEKQSNLFKYDAVIKKGNEYLFTVTNPGKLDFELWKADVTINPSSYVEIKVSNGKFLPKAHLNGQLTMNIGLKNGGEAEGDKNKNAKIAKVTFEALEIQSVKPYVKVGSFSLGVEGGDSGVGGFPITINEISGSSTENTIKLGIDLTLSLIGEGDGGFAANGKFNIVAESVENGRDLSYKFKELQFERFGIDIDKGTFKFKGTLNIYKADPIYGNGISGTIDATFNPGIRVAASAIFGTVNGTRYWYVDALAEFKSGITIFPGFAFYGFGGGAYYHMKIDDKGVGSPLGKTVSGIVYVPDESVYFGLKAAVTIGVQPGYESFNGDAVFEMAFNRGGGLKYINFRGNGYFMATPETGGTDGMKEKSGSLATATKKAGGGNLNEKNSTAAEEVLGNPKDSRSSAQVWASLVINYDFDNRILHGNLKAYVNVANGLLKGGGANNLAGEAVLHFAPGEWYIYIGRPEYENRFALEVLGIARLDAYFVIGTVIPDSPPPPEEVSSILGGIDLDYMSELNALGDGAGIGFGASFKVDTGDKTFLMFYGRFKAGLGFDIMLKDYGDVQCKGSGQLGVNGWYANGQAYAYFEGNIGIKVRIFGRKKKIPILEVGAAVVAQAMLPNPTWVRGIAGGKFRALGGLVKGNCKFEIEIGKKCQIISGAESVLDAVEVVAEMTPADGGTQVDVFTLPQAVFNYEMEKEYEMVDDLTGSVIRFKISLDEIAIKAGGTPIKADIKWNDDKTVAALTPFEVLPPEQSISFDIVTSFKEGRDGGWHVVEADGQKLVKRNTVAFTTGKAPDYIPVSNVLYSYPSLNQYHLYKGEYAQGYITLKQGQDYLFNTPQEWSKVIRFVNTATRAPLQTSFEYATSEKELRFNISSAMTNDQIYEMVVALAPKTGLGSVDKNVTAVTSDLQASTGTELSLTTKNAEGSIKENKEREMLKTYLHTSKYNTFREKIVSLNPSAGWRSPLLAGVHMIGSNIGGSEMFSFEELYGVSGRNAPLVQLEADLTNVPWFTDEINPIIYKDYPFAGIRISSTNRDPSILGIVPTKGVYIYQYPYDFNLSTDIVSSGSLPVVPTVGRFDYYLAKYMYYDYLDLANQAANYVAAHGTNARLTKLVTSTFPVIKKGDYWINIRYVLPGKNIVTSTYRHKIFNPID